MLPPSSPSSSSTTGSRTIAALSTPTFAVVPVRDRLDLTQTLLSQLDGTYDTVFVLDNGSEDDTWRWLSQRPRKMQVEPVAAAGLGIYAMWNLGARLARERAATCDIAFLNNDIHVGPGFLGALRDGLRSADDLWAVSANHRRHPLGGVQRSLGTFKSGGFAGFAFMARGEIFDRVGFDESFSWWYGDDDFIAQIQANGGRVGVVGPATVDHIDGGSQTARYDRERLAAIERDRRRMWSKWGHF